MRISVSQIKAFMKSPSQWAGQNILGIKDVVKNDAFNIGKWFHHYVQTGNKEQAYEMLNGVEDVENSVIKLDNLIFNFNLMWIKTIWKNEVKFNANIFGIDFLGYLDNVEDSLINEYKSTSSLSNKDDKPAMRQAVNSYEEYALQSWIYMKCTGINTVRLIEVLNQDTLVPENTTITKDKLIELCQDFNSDDSSLTKKDIVAKYSPRRPSSQIIMFTMTDEFDSEMTAKYEPIIKEMSDMYSKFKK